MDNSSSPLKAFKRRAPPDWAIEQLRLVLDLTDEEVARLEKPLHTAIRFPAHLSDPAELARIRLASGSSPQR